MQKKDAESSLRSYIHIGNFHNQHQVFQIACILKCYITLKAKYIITKSKHYHDLT